MLLAFSFAWLMPLLTPIVMIVGTALAALITKRIVTPSDQQRADLLSKIANDACALLMLQYPKNTWNQLFDLLVKTISSAAGLPTSNLEAIKRAAAAALEARGLKPTS